MIRRLALLGLAIASLSTPAFSATSYEANVVNLTVTYQTYDQDRPWLKRTPESRFPLGVVVDGPLLLTTAQMVTDATLIEVQKLGRATRVPARIAWIDPDVDLALLTVDAPRFFEDLAPVRLASGIPVDGSVLSVRWRTRRIEVSASRVARIEVQATPQGTIEYPFLHVTTDLRGGGWSEPVFSDGELIGLTVSQNEQTARVLPVDVIAPFLRMTRAGNAYPGFADLGIRWQVNEDSALAAYLGQQGEPEGVVVSDAPWGSSVCGVLRSRDILLSLDGHEIDASGFYRHPRLGLLRFTYIPVDGHQAGDRLAAEVLRGGKVVKVEIPLLRANAEKDLVPERRPDSAPAYLEAGGLVFRELDGPYLRSWGEDWRKKAPVDLQVWRALFSESQSPSRRRLIVLSGVLPLAYNLGYHRVGDVLVETINGRAVDSISKVAEAFAHPEGGFHRIVLYPNAGRSEIILDAEGLERATEEALREYRIPERVRHETQLPDLGKPCE